MFIGLHKLQGSATVILVFSVTCTRALACSCAPPRPPCEAVAQSQLIFLGTVTEVNAQSDHTKTARMHIDRAYKGALSETIELFDDGMCDGPNLEIGRQYLMYTSGSPTGLVPARGCTRSRRVEAADEDLKFLEQYSKGKVTTHISGTVRFWPDGPEDSNLGEAGRSPLKDVLITLFREGKEFQTITDALGAFFFSGLPPGKYALDAGLSGYRANWAPDELVLHANACVQVDVLMKVDRRVQGVVRDAKGVPVPGALIEMVPTNTQLKRWEHPVLLDVSDTDGHYAVDGIPPGEYYLGVNIMSTPTKEHPFPRTYYPNTTDIGHATRVLIAVGSSLQEFDLSISDRLPLVRIQGRVLNADGSPPLAEDRPHVRIKEPGLYGQVEQDDIAIDVQGRFHFDLCEGVPYSAFAFSGPTRATKYSAPVEFTPTKEHDRLELVLDKTAEEFRKLRQK